MVYTYTPTYYSSIQDSITSICKNILPFSFKKRRLPAIVAAEQRLSKQQSDNLKWQQESFHQILNLMGLCKEGILPENEVSVFRTHLLETVITSPVDHEPPVILRDKLIFLQELLYAKCISEDEYHASKRPLLQRLAVQGAEIEARDVIMGQQKEASSEGWSVIDLKDDKNPAESLPSKKKSKEGSAVKQIKGAASVFGFVSPNKSEKFEEKNSKFVGNNTVKPIDQNLRTSSVAKSGIAISTENPFWNSHLDDKENDSKSILMTPTAPGMPEKKQSFGDKPKKKPFKTLFLKEQKEALGNGANDNIEYPEEKEKMKSAKKSWGFDGLKKWMKNDSEEETAPLSLGEKSDGASYTGHLVANPIAEGPDTKQMKSKLHPDGAPTDFFVDKVLGNNIRKELHRIQAELGAKNSNEHLSDDQIEAISTRLPVDKADLKKFFPKSWCDRYGDVVLDVVRKEFKDHVGDMGNSRKITTEKQNSRRWTTFDDDVNSYPNLFAPPQNNYSSKRASLSTSKNGRRTSVTSSIEGFKYNPFFDA